MKKKTKLFLAAAVVCLGFGWVMGTVTAEATENTVAAETTEATVSTTSADDYGTVVTNTDGTEEATGKCGDNLTWTLYENSTTGSTEYTLVIDGTGAMTDYTAGSVTVSDDNTITIGTVEGGEVAPWYKDCVDVVKNNNVKIVLSDGITHIGNCAFQAPERPLSGGSIEYYMSLTGNLNIPNSVESIGTYAFAYNCLTGDLLIPDSVKTIKEGAFTNTRAGTMFTNGNIIVGYGVTDADADIFSGYASGSNGDTKLFNLSNTSIGGDGRRAWPLEQDGTIYTITRHYNDAIGSSTTRKVLSQSAMDSFSDDLKAKLQQYATFPNDFDKVAAADTTVEFDWYSDAEYKNQISSESDFTDNKDVYGKRKDFSGTEYGIQVKTGTFAGTSLTWTVYDSFDEDTAADTLVISGTGAMPDYASAADTPWYDYKDTLKCLVLEEGVTHIGAYAFYGLGGNDFKFEGELNLPSTITSIGEYAFTGDKTDGNKSGTQFTGNLVLPENITEIGKYAFAYNAFTGALILPENLKEIPEGTFCGSDYYSANKFEYVVVPETVTTIGDNAFASGDYKYYNFSTTEFKNYSWQNAKIPESGFITVTRHYDDGAKTVTTRNALPDGVLVEKDYPYSNYPYANYHSFPNDLENEYAKGTYRDLTFTWYSDAACTKEAGTVTSFTAGNTYEYYAKSNHTGEYYASEVAASGDCGEQGNNVTWALLGETGNYTLVINGTGAMADYAIAKAPWNGDRSAIQKIIVNAGVTRIGNYAFYACNYNYKTTELELPDTLKSIGESAFEQSTVSRDALILPEGVESVEKNAFMSTGDFTDTKLILPESLKQIGENAFKWSTTGGWIIIGSNAQISANTEYSINNFPSPRNEYCDTYFYNFSQIDIGETWKATKIVDMPTITKTIYSPDNKTSKTITRKILSSDQLSESTYPADTYPQLVKYRTFPSDVDKINGKSLTWYSDESLATKVDSLSGITEATTVYAQCPGHEDADKDGKCDFCGYGKTLKITGVIEKEIAFTDKYTVPDCVYLVDDAGNRVTEVTEGKELTALFAITTASPVLTDSIAMDYTVRVAATETVVPAMTFTFNGKTYSAQAVETETTGSYKEFKFTLSEINPSQMSDAIVATVSLGDKTVVKKDYSVKAYCESVLGKDATALSISEAKYNKLQELLVDLLYYGDEAQKYVGLSATATSGLTEAQKALRTASGKNSPYNDTNIYGGSSSEYAWKSAALYLKDRVAVMLTFTAEDIEGLSIKVEMNSATKEYTDFKKDANGNYYVILDGVAPGQYNSTMQARFYKNDSQVGATLMYSVESYIYRKQNDEKLKDILQTILDYGKAAETYKAAN